MQLKFGMSPISWTNDDLPQLGGDTSLETCLRETRLAGYSGSEMGGKFPKDSASLAKVLAEHDLQLVSGWFSGTLLDNTVENELERIKPQLELFASLYAPVIVYGETWETVQNRQDQPLMNKPVLAEADFPAYGERLTRVAEFCASQGVPLAFHHHMGTGVETEYELDLAMENTGEAVGLLVDTGHLLFAGGDILRVIEKYGHRINHFHAKDIRADILKTVDRGKDSFLDCVLRGVFTVPGDGMIDYGPIMKALADKKFEGWVIVEAEQDPALADPYEYACIGYQALEKAASNAGYTIVE
ncbi:MAG: myo-inosose-2 dehydratase [Gammaproteobacteria bacterium]|nr:myo-inosose-2 dehydratase [Gammaproteobacteria bacterium]